MTPVIDCHAHVVPPAMWRSVTFSSKNLRYLVDLVGADRLLLGSDYPFEMGDVDPVGTVRAAVAPEHQTKVLGGTPQRLLCLDAACGCGAPREQKAEETR